MCLSCVISRDWTIHLISICWETWFFALGPISPWMCSLSQSKTPPKPDTLPPPPGTVRLNEYSWTGCAQPQESATNRDSIRPAGLDVVAQWLLFTCCVPAWKDPESRVTWFLFCLFCFKLMICAIQLHAEMAFLKSGLHWAACAEILTWCLLSLIICCHLLCILLLVNLSQHSCPHIAMCCLFLQCSLPTSSSRNRLNSLWEAPGLWCPPTSPKLQLLSLLFWFLLIFYSFCMLFL